MFVQATHCLKNAQELKLRDRKLALSFAPSAVLGRVTSQSHYRDPFAYHKQQQSSIQSTQSCSALANPSPSYTSGQLNSGGSSGTTIDVAAYAAHARNKRKALWPSAFEVSLGF